MWRWHRYHAVLVGRDGHRTPLPFVRFRHYWQAQNWADRMNLEQDHLAHLYPPIMHFGYERIRAPTHPPQRGRPRRW